MYTVFEKKFISEHQAHIGNASTPRGRGRSKHMSSPAYSFIIFPSSKNYFFELIRAVSGGGVSKPASRSRQRPPIPPSAANTNVITAPNNTAPKAIEATTIILGKSDGTRGAPNNFSARLSPIAPPSKLPGSSPKKAKMTRPTPAPIYIAA